MSTPSFFILLSIYWLNYIIQTINFHSLKKLQAFCPLGDAIRPKAKQTEIREADFIHHTRCSRGWGKVPKGDAVQTTLNTNKQQAKKCFSFLKYEDTQTHVKTLKLLKVWINAEEINKSLSLHVAKLGSFQSYRLCLCSMRRAPFWITSLYLLSSCFSWGDAWWAAALF